MICALLMSAICVTPASAAFIIECQTTVYGSKELPHPIQWKWDGVELRTSYKHVNPEIVFELAPVHFQERVIDRDGLASHGLKATLYTFVMSVERNGDRMSRSFMVMEANSKVSLLESSGFVSEAGGLLSVKETTYRDCTWQKL
ncbi:hypothetical protein [Achromobacter sp. GbtcB20]|uniref:hypothetical protein n=1 Tax=Achromobacter sp. GbtcB20 TaxID=2824765 RepID=UPI001266DD2A|nr:hypothetical protein [Achromobacter sp. GbtcB20]